MTNNTYHWHKIADSLTDIPFSPEGLAQVQAGGKTICIAKANNTLHACTQKCPHAGGHMANGFIDAAGNIVCPLHRYKFSLQSGRNVSGEGYFLKIFPIEVRDNGIFVGFAENNLFGWLK